MDPVIDLLKKLDEERAPHFQNDLRDYETKAMAAKLARENWEKDCKEVAKQGGAIPPRRPFAEPDDRRALAGLRRMAGLQMQTTEVGPAGGRPRSDYKVDPKVYALVSARQN